MCTGDDLLCFVRYEEDHMTRLSNRQKSHNLGRSSRDELEDIVDFSSLKGLATKVKVKIKKKKRFAS